MKFPPLLALTWSTLALVGCGSPVSQGSPQGLRSDIPTTPIATLATFNPVPDPETTSYALVGEVRQVAPLVQGQVYELQDGSGSIWVLSSGTDLLQPGDRVLLHGFLRYESVPLAGADQGEHYVVEEKQVQVQRQEELN